MEEAVIAGAFGLLLWYLARIPGLNPEERLFSRVRADSEVLGRLPDGEARNALASSVESDVLRLLALRERPPKDLRLGTAGERWIRGSASGLLLLLSVPSLVVAVRHLPATLSSRMALALLVLAIAWVILWPAARTLAWALAPDRVPYPTSGRE